MERTLLLVPSGSFYYFNSMKLPNVVVFLCSAKFMARPKWFGKQ